MLSVALLVGSGAAELSASEPVVSSYSAAAAKAPGGSVELFVTVSGSPTPTIQWRHDGVSIAGAASSSLTISGLSADDTGIYSATATNSDGNVTVTAIVGLLATAKVTGAGEAVLPLNIVHPNGNVFDQILLTGASEAITADAGQVTRTSYIDDDGDIVQVEFSGPGALSLVLMNPGARAAPVNYYQPSVQYMKGHAGIVIAGATEETNVSVFTVGRATAFDPTGAYDITKDISATNDPARNGSPLFQGHAATNYDGIADLAFIAIMSANGKFGGLRAANANFYSMRGYTGIHAPGVRFSGPVRVGDISAFDSAWPEFLLGSAADVSVHGGDLFQDNNRPVQVSGIAQLKFVAGGDSHGRSLAAQQNRAVLMQNSQDVTNQIVVDP